MNDANAIQGPAQNFPSPGDPASAPISAPEVAGKSLWYFVWLRLRRNHIAMVGGALLVALLFVAVFGYFYAADLYNVQTRDVRMAPSATHWFGTDDLGRDIFHRILFGAHLTIGSGLCIVILAALFGVPLGLASAWFGGKFDAWAMRSMDMILAFPSILLAMAVMAALGFNMRNIIIAIALVYVPKFARVVRASAMVERSADYARAAEALGCSRSRIMLLHLLPNCIAPVLVLATLSLGSAILEAAALSFLNLGVQPPLPEWGRMLNDGRSGFQTSPHIMLFPGLAIASTVLAINLLGDGLRDAFDVRLGK
jgi:peptide/nickel transport system permease protein